MKLRNRFLLLGIGVVIFVICTPIAVLYALGYKFDVSTRKITKTGSLVTKSEPQRSLIYIDNQLQSAHTGSTIRFLLPGDYNFTIDRDGYQSWTKRLTIRPSLVTWANHERDFVTLFYDKPVVKNSQVASQTSVSIKENSATIVDDSGVSSYNPDRQNFQNISSQTPALNPPAILPNQEATYFFLRYAPAKNFTAEQLAGSKQLESNDRYGVLLSGGNLLVSNNGTVSVFASAVSGFNLDNEHLWYVEKGLLKHANLNIGVIEQLAALPYTPISSLVIRGDSQIFLVLDQTAYALNDELEEIYRGVTYAKWDDEYNRLILANNNEALLFDPGLFRTELIIRSSSPIIQPIANRRTGYLFFINEDKIKAIELDGRDHRNVYTISEAPAKSFLLSEDGVHLTVFTDTDLSWMEIR
jgi:hypothetical protein